MRALQLEQVEEARRMRERGESWRSIGRAFMCSDWTVMAAVDPIFAERRRQHVRDTRQRHGRAREARNRPQVVVALPEPRQANTIFENRHGKFYVFRCMGQNVPLPYVSIQHGEH